MTRSLVSRSARRAARTILGRWMPDRFGPGRYRSIADEYRVSDLVVEDGKVPLVWWPVAPNFGDLLSPWLIEKMTGIPAGKPRPGGPSYVSIGSVIKRALPGSLVWGTGMFGQEAETELQPDATYLAVRGPLTRARLLSHGMSCPEVYGDPALLAPLYYHPEVKKTHEIGVIVRWSERKWQKVEPGPGVRLIDFGTDKIEETIDAILSCKRVVTSSLHGLIVADAYGIPSAWLASTTPKGRDFKFHDYNLSVNKHRTPKKYDLAAHPLTVEQLDKVFDFDGRAIEFHDRRLLDACPFLERV